MLSLLQVHNIEVLKYDSEVQMIMSHQSNRSVNLKRKTNTFGFSYVLFARAYFFKSF